MGRQAREALGRGAGAAACGRRREAQPGRGGFAGSGCGEGEQCERAPRLDLFGRAVSSVGCWPPPGSDATHYRWPSREHWLARSLACGANGPVTTGQRVATGQWPVQVVSVGASACSLPAAIRYRDLRFLHARSMM